MSKDRRRGRRLDRRQAVSPIVATILLVAITVVLAAVLYILISNTEREPTGPPIGSTFAYGAQQKFQAPAAWHLATNGCDYHNLCYDLAVGLNGPGLTAANLVFGIQNSLGVAQTFAGVSILDTQGNLQAQYIPGAGWSMAVPAACPGGDVCGNAAPITSGTVLLVDTGVLFLGGPSYTGDTLIAFGANGYTSQVDVGLI